MKIINGRYEIIDEMARGEFGVIYHVLDHADNDNHKALKMYNTDKLGEVHIRRFRQEFLLLHSCYMPNVVRVYDFEQVKILDGVLFSGKYWFYTMEKLKGTILKDYSFKNSAEKRNIFEKIAWSLRWLHANEYAHGDVSPSNILITPEGGIIFLDLGPDANAEKDTRIFKELCHAYDVKLDPHQDPRACCEGITNRLSLSLDFLPGISDDVKNVLKSTSKSKEVIKIINCASYNPVFYTLISRYSRSYLQIQGYEVYDIMVNPNFYSFFSHLLFVLKAKEQYRMILEKESFITNYIENYTSNPLDKTSANAFSFEIHDALLKLLEKLSYVSPLAFIIENYHFIDSKSEEALNYLWKHYSGNRIVFVVSSTDAFQKKKARNVQVETVNLFNSKDEFLKEKNSFYQKSGLAKRIQSLFYGFSVHALHKLFETLTTENLLTLLSNNEHLGKLCHIKDNAIEINDEHYAAGLVSSESVILEQIMSHEQIKRLFMYFVYLDKPVRIDMLAELMGENVDKFVLLLIKANIFSKVDDNRIQPYDIAVYHSIRGKIISDVVDDENAVLQQILHVHEKYEEELSDSERFLFIYYMSKNGNYEKVAEWIERYYLMPLTINFDWLISLFHDFLAGMYADHAQSFSHIKDEKSRAIYHMFFYKLHYYHQHSGMKGVFKELLMLYTTPAAATVIKMEKIKYYLDAAEIDAIEQDINDMYQLFTSLSAMYQTLLLRHLAVYYFSRWDFPKAIACARDVFSQKNAVFEPKIYWGLLDTVVRSYAYMNDFKRGESYARYFLKKAHESNEDQWISLAYYTASYVPYRQHNYEEARENDLKALYHAEKTYDYFLLASINNSIGLFSDDPDMKVEYYQKSLRYTRITNQRIMLFTTLCNLMQFYQDRLDYKKVMHLLTENERFIFTETKNSETSLMRRHLHVIFFSLFSLYLSRRIDWIHNYLKILKTMEPPKGAVFYDFYTLVTHLTEYIATLLEGVKNPARSPFVVEMIARLHNNQSLRDEDHFILRTYYTWILPLMSEKDKKLLLQRTMEQFAHAEDGIKPYSRFVMYYKLCMDMRVQKSRQRRRYIELNYTATEKDFWDAFGDYFKYSVLVEYLELLRDQDGDIYTQIRARARDIYKKLHESVSDESVLAYTYWNVIFDEMRTKLTDYELIVGDKNLKTVVRADNLGPMLDVFQAAYYDEDIKTERILRTLLSTLGYERLILFIRQFDDVSEVLRVHEHTMFYNHCEKCLATQDDLPADMATIIMKNIPHGDIKGYMIIPLIRNRDYKRIKYLNAFASSNDEGPRVRGYIYLDKKNACPTRFDEQKISLLMLHLSLLWENREIEAKYMRDPLTKLFFRDVFISKLRDYIFNDETRTKHFVLMILDIDHFKTVNDLYGHQKGDEVLTQVSAIIEKSLRKNDIVGRYGGEEFVVALLNHHLDGGMKVAERIRKNIERAKLLGALRSLTISIGVVEYPTDAVWIDELICKADECLYRAKKHGRNRVITVL